MIKTKTILLILSLLLSPFKLNAETGKASHYSVKSNKGTKTASGIPLDDSKLTAAHKKFPFGTVVKVTNLSNGKFVECKITDDGPHIKGRIIDLSQKAAEVLDFKNKGITTVAIDIISLPKNQKWRR